MNNSDKDIYFLKDTLLCTQNFKIRAISFATKSY